MVSFVAPPALLLAVPLTAFTVYLWRNGYVNLGPVRNRVALAVRLALIEVIVLTLAGASLHLPENRQAVVFVADLSASDLHGRNAIRAFIRSATGRQAPANASGVVAVGAQAEVEQPAASRTRFDDFQTTVNPDYTNLAGGLELANALLPDGYRHRVVVLSDGQQNVGDALSAARLLRSIGVRVDVVPVRTSSGPEVLVDGVDVPSQLRPQERFSLTVSVRSTVATTTNLTIYQDRSLVLNRQEPVHPGANTYSFEQAPLHPGFHSYRAEIAPAIDTEYRNNSGSASTQVQGPPRVLVIAASRSEAVNVMASLHSTGIHADLRRPADVIPTLGYLQRYAAVVIVDTAADELDPDLVDQLVPYVRDLGHGLVVIGGREAYGMGGYGQTGLEQALPVTMDLPKRKDLPSAAVVLIIENLEAETQVNISKQAGKGVVNLLTQQDQIAVSDALGDGSFVARLQHVTNKRAIDQAIDQMQPGDPQSYAADLQAAYDVLRHTQARVKHIILLGDGDAEDTSYESVVKRIRAGGVTVSTVATNGLGFNDFQTMQYIARWGGGRYYRGDDTSAIPKIFLREARTVARSGIIEGKFYPQENSPNPMVRDLRAVPPLYGYVATTPKPTGEMVLVSKKLDPVLAGWQFGLGRSVAWTSDAGGLWTRDWLQAPGANRFWANLVSWTLPAVQGGQLYTLSSSAQGEGRVSVDTPPSLGANPSVTAHILGPASQATTIQLQPSAPGHFSGSFPANAQGSYFITAEAHGAGHAEAGQTGLDVSYSAEYRATGINPPFLRALAEAGGGDVINRPAQVWLDNLSPVFADRSLANWLRLLALLLLPLDIAVRRLIVTRQDLIAVVTALGRREVRAEPAVASLQAVRRLRNTSSRAGRSTVRAGAAMPKQSARPEGSAATVRVQAPPRKKEAPASEAPAPQPEQEGTTSGHLLASKRRRR